LPSRPRRVVVALGAAILLAGGLAVWLLTRGGDGTVEAAPAGLRAGDLSVVTLTATAQALSAQGAQITAAAAVIRAPVIDTGTDVPKPEVIELKMQPDVLFHYRRCGLTQPGRTAVERAISRMRLYDAIQWVRVDGHTDARGTARHNLRLSGCRIRSVIRPLRQARLPGRPRMIPRAYGESRPVAPNIRPDGSDDPAGRRLNRRVVITFRTLGR
jgi:outer membrane protein OmpA-like peptidoglycan-associated protein